MNDNNQDIDLSRLNPEQVLAVKTTQGPVLVLSGAGSGKTTVLTTRIAYIIQQKLAFPSQCLAVTFTNKAAKEMQNRLENKIGDCAKSVWVGTFHSICKTILRTYAEKINLKSNFQIISSNDQERLFKEVMISENIDIKKVEPSDLFETIQRIKDEGLTYENAHLSRTNPHSLVITLYQKYQERLHVMNCVDFGDLLLYCVELFKKNPDVLAQVQHKFKYIMVDEYQDTNIVQYIWLRLLSGGYHNICCVGDDDQSIYSWRGAEVKNILKFSEDFPNATIIKLESNYRSTAHILGAASGLISHNEQRMEKTLHTAPGREEITGSPILVHTAWSENDEVSFICEKIEALQRKNTSLNDIAILVRANFQTRGIEEALIRYSIPYIVVNGTKFYDREEVKDALAYIKFLLHHEDDMSLTRIINTPARGIGKKTLESISEYANQNQISIYSASKIMMNNNAIKGAAKKGFEEFYALVENWVDCLNNGMLACDLFDKILNDTGYISLIKTKKDNSFQDRLENLKEMKNTIARDITFEEYIDHIALISDTDIEEKNGEYVCVMTLHGAKGLEFGHVFLPGWEEGIFPHQKVIDDLYNPMAIEEERRLAYVGITRAKYQCYISLCTERFYYGDYKMNSPSRFLEEIPKEHIIIDQSSSYEFNEDFIQKPKNQYTKNTYKSSKFNSSGYFGGFTQNFKVNDVVYHDLFGTGIIVEIDNDSAKVKFSEDDIKTIKLNYLEQQQ
ncbi:MAG: UvrD-helicase domain-containing protein [Alphaproteobacteria bacterium]|nr:UvrD-helicase domain-containing protein [Alphaproteobacteria bacterium]